MTTIRTWDLFDTLIGRKCGTALRLFEQMATLLDDAHFVERRLTAERRLQDLHVEYSLDDIYMSYTDLFKGPLSADVLAEMEWSLELENVFLIKSCAAQVREGDLIVSDMYLSAHQLAMLMERAGFHVQVKIIVSCYGKHTGQVWKALKNQNIAYHIGDNLENDVRKPRTYGIRTQLASTGLTPAEKFYLTISPDLAWWLRWQRLSLDVNNERLDKLLRLQVDCNAPFLWAACHLLADYAKAEGVTRLLFMARDGQIFKQMFDELYPEMESHYLYINRELLRSGSDNFFAYLNGLLTDDALLVDVAASCGSLVAALPRLTVKAPRIWTAIFLLEPWRVKLGPVRMECGTTNVQTQINNTAVEMLNYADHWHVADVDERGRPSFDQADEYDLGLVQAGHWILTGMIKSAPRRVTTLDKRSLWAILNHALEEMHKERAFLKETFPLHTVYEQRRKHSKAFTGDSVDVVVLGVISRYDWRQIECWWKSLKLTGFGGEIHLLVYDPITPYTLNQLRAHGIIIHREKLNGQLVVDRFRDAAKLAKVLSADTWVVFTDVGDLVFQRDPAAFLAKCATDIQIVVASEGVKFSGNRWALKNLVDSFPEHFETIKDHLLYNAGSTAVRAGTLAQLGCEVYELCCTKPKAQKHDQAALNILLHQKYETQTLFFEPDGGWCFNGASSIFADAADAEKYLNVLPQIEDGKCFFGDETRQPVMFHHYTRNEKVKRDVEKRIQSA